jgi:hypothetical protein
MTDGEILQLATAPDKIFLGERYTELDDGSVATCNTDNNLEKVERAWQLITDAQRGKGTVTPRNCCSFISLLLWLGDTLSVTLCDYPEVLRTYSTIAKSGQAGGWDTPLKFLASSLVRHLLPLLALVRENAPVRLPTMPDSPDKPYDAQVGCIRLARREYALPATTLAWLHPSFCVG